MGTDSSGSRAITQMGYAFLLRGPHEQLWALLRRFVTLQQNRSGNNTAGRDSFATCSWIAHQLYLQNTS